MIASEPAPGTASGDASGLCVLNFFLRNGRFHGKS